MTPSGLTIVGKWFGRNGGTATITKTVFTNINGKMREYAFQGNPWLQHKAEKIFAHCVNCGYNKQMSPHALVCVKRPCVDAAVEIPHFVPKSFYQIVPGKESDEVPLVTTYLGEDVDCDEVQKLDTEYFQYAQEHEIEWTIEEMDMANTPDKHLKSLAQMRAETVNKLIARKALGTANFNQIIPKDKSPSAL